MHMHAYAHILTYTIALTIHIHTQIHIKSSKRKLNIFFVCSSIPLQFSLHYYSCITKLGLICAILTSYCVYILEINITDEDSNQSRNV